MKKYDRRLSRLSLSLILLLLAVLAMAACSPSGSSAGTTTPEGTEQVFSLEELAQFDGLEGRQAFIAVDGIVYDVTDIAQWKDGIHQGRFQAGKDYSDEIRSESPHGTAMLSRAKLIGVLAE